MLSCCAPAEITERVRHGLAADPSTRLFSKGLSSAQLPFIYHRRYNVSFLGIENLHPLDPKKYGHVVNMMLEDGVLEGRHQLCAAQRAPRSLLLEVHAEEYLKAIETSSSEVARIAELPLLRLLPAAVLRSRVLAPMQYMAGGTLQGAVAALERGWAVNIGGGMHHASFDDGGGWCFWQSNGCYYIIQQCECYLQ